MTKQRESATEIRDFVIIGGGPAGMSAALVATGNSVDTLLLEKNKNLGGQVFKYIDDPVGDFLGQTAKDGKILAERFLEHIESQKVEYQTQMFIRRITRQEDHLHIEIENDKFLRARRVLLASGVRPRRLNVPGEFHAVAGSARKQIDRFRGTRVVIVGGGDEAAETAVRLASGGAQVFMLVRSQLGARLQFRAPLLATPGVEIMTGEQVAALEGEEQLKAVQLVSGKKIEADACFIRIGAEVQAPETDPPVERHEDGRVKVDRAGRTSIHSIFAAGDLVEPPERRYISVAIARGTIVGRAVEQDLEKYYSQK
jgi:alkyl hydroperoxide reductase subunit F